VPTEIINLALFIIYVLCLAYAFQQMKKDILSRVVLNIAVNRAAMEEQLFARDLQDLVEISFKFEDQYPLTPVPHLSMTLANRSESQWIYLHWADSTLTNFEGQSQRIVRISPSLTVELCQAQLLSAIAPGQVIRETLTTEETLRHNEAGVLAVATPLFSAKVLHEAALKNQRSSLQLVLRVGELGDRNGRFCLISCEFIPSKVSWRRMMYWTAREKKKKKK